MRTDKDVAYQIAQILVREITAYRAPEGQPLPAALETVVDGGCPPLITYAALAAELNQVFDLLDNENRFTPQNIDEFLGILLKESINYPYRTGNCWHLGRIRKKIDVDIPITAIVVNAKAHVPGKKLFSYVDLPHATAEESRASTILLLAQLVSYSDWGDYLKRVDKVFGKK